MRHGINLSVRSLILLSLAVAFLPFFLIVIYTGWERLHDSKENLRTNCEVAATTLASFERTEVSAARQLLASLGSIGAFQDNNQDTALRIFAEITMRNPQFMSIGVADAQGIVYASHPHQTVFSVAARKYFKDAVRSRDFSAGDLVRGRTTGLPTIHFSYPSFKGDGTLSGVLWVGFDLKRFDKMLSLSALPAGTRLSVVEPEGMLVHATGILESRLYQKMPAAYIAKVFSKERQGTFVQRDAEGDEYIHSYHQLRLTDRSEPYLVIDISVPVEQSLASAHLKLLRNSLFIGIAALLAGLVAWFTGEIGIVAPIHKLATAAHRLGEGELTVRCGIKPNQKTDIGRLAWAFDTMGDAVAKREEERLVNEKALREGEERYRQILDNVLEGVAVIREGGLYFVNPSLSKISGYETRELIGQELLDFVHSDDRDMVVTYHRRRLAKERAPDTFEFRLVHKNGTSRWVSASEVLIAWKGSPATLLFIIDLTERKAAENDREKLQERLRLSERMEAIGRLAGGIAHDLNNMLTPIIGYTEMATRAISTTDKLRATLDSILDCANRAKDLTKQILAFSRRQVLQLQVLNLNSEITAMGRMLKPLIGENIRLEVKLSEEIWLVRADSSQIHQVIMNLAVNARDAMLSGGAIRITSRNTVVAESCPDIHKGPPKGEFALVEISDTGCGMDAVTLSKIFEPFFTTKERGKGTGLGLATVYGIIKQHEGFIYVRSSVGHGTTFSIYLPRVQGTIPDAEPAPPAPVPMEQHQLTPDELSATILVVEDEQPVREMTVAVLKQRGYNIISAESGEEALEIVREGQVKLDLLVSDVIMPGINGRELFDALLPSYPNLKVLYVSGYAANIIGEYHTGKTPAMHLQKPFSIDSLIQVVAQSITNTTA